MNEQEFVGSLEPVRESGGMVTISREEYDRLVTCRNYLALIERAYHSSSSYAVDSATVLIFGKKEDPNA